MGLDLILRDSSKIDYFIGLNPQHLNGNGQRATEDVYDLVARRFAEEEKISVG